MTLNVNGGNSAGLSISPNPVQFNSVVNGATQSTQVTVSSNVGGNLSIVGVAPVPGWLSTTPGPFPASLSANQQFSFNVFANPSGLAAANYSANISVTIGSQQGNLAVNLAVGSGGGGGTGTTSVSPSALNFSYQTSASASSIAPQRLVITGPAGAWSSTVSVASPSNGNWLKLNPSSGSSLPDPSFSGAAPVVTIDPTGSGRRHLHWHHRC